MSTILDKIRALRNLATSSNVNEAAAAAALAEKLLQQHCLSEADLDTPEITDAMIEDTAVTWRQQVPRWQSCLLEGLAKQYQVAVVLSRGKPTKALAYGRSADIETLKYQLAFFSATIARLRASLGRGKGRTWGESFSLGAVNAIIAALRTQSQTERTHATSNALAVVDNRAKAAEELMRRMNDRIRKSSPGTVRTDRDAYEAGQRAGANMNARPAMAGGMRLLGAG